jgi:hypothetical protein
MQRLSRTLAIHKAVNVQWVPQDSNIATQTSINKGKSPTVCMGGLPFKEDPGAELAKADC